MGRSSGVEHASHLDVDIRTTAAVLAAQIDALVARRRRGVRDNAERLVARPSENLSECMSCLARRIKAGVMAADEVPGCVATPVLFEVVEGIGGRVAGVGRETIVTALERLSALMRDLPSLDESRLIAVRDFLVETANDRRVVPCEPESHASSPTGLGVSRR